MAQRSMTYSPLALAREALTIAQASLSPYSSPFSKKTYTQHQLFALLVLRQFFKTDYRGIIEIVRDWTDLREALGLKSVPNFSTLCYAQQRLVKKGLSAVSWRPSSTGLARSA